MSIKSEVWFKVPVVSDDGGSETDSLCVSCSSGSVLKRFNPCEVSEVSVTVMDGFLISLRAGAAGVTTL